MNRTQVASQIKKFVKSNFSKENPVVHCSKMDASKIYVDFKPGFSKETCKELEKQFNDQIKSTGFHTTVRVTFF